MRASSASRLRKARAKLLTRFYNSCNNKESKLASIFENYRQWTPSGCYNYRESVISRNNISEAIGDESGNIVDEIFSILGIQKENRILFSSFLRYLETGQILPPKDFRVTNEKRECSHYALEQQRAVYGSVWCLLNFQCVHTLDSKCCNTLSFPLKTYIPNTKKEIHYPGGIWKKKETTIHEKITIYTTIDEDGTLQELTETEKKMDEVFHMETKDTGEFSHREFSQYEKTEKFNKEPITGIRGTEEYIHLKSTDDEYECFDNNMPSAMNEI